MEWFKPQFPEWWTALPFPLAALGRVWNPVFDHCTWVLFIKKTHIFLFLVSSHSKADPWLWGGSFVISLHRNCSRENLERSLGKLMFFRRVRQQWKHDVWTLQVKAGNTWDHGSEGKPDVDVKSWKTSLGTYRSCTWIMSLSFRYPELIIWCKTMSFHELCRGPCHGPRGEMVTFQIGHTSVIHSSIYPFITWTSPASGLCCMLPIQKWIQESFIISEYTAQSRYHVSVLKVQRGDPRKKTTEWFKKEKG